MTQIASVLARFGNVREAAAAIGRPPSVIQYWRSKGRIPANSQRAVIDAGARRGIKITPADLIPVKAEAAQ